MDTARTIRRGTRAWRAIAAPVVFSLTAARAQITPLLSEPACVPGSTLVLPVDVEAGVAPGPIGVLTDGGIECPARLERLSPEIRAPKPTPLDQWLGPSLDWNAESGHAGSTRLDRWFVVIETPAEPRPDFLRIGGRLVTPHWLSTPEEMGALTPPEAWEPPPVPDETMRRAVLAGAERGRTDPMRRWRWLLATNRLGPEHARDLVSLGVPILDALALQQEARWRSALARLHLIDPTLGLRVRRRLLAAVRFEPDFALPAWDENPTRLDTLLRTVLDPALTPFAIAGMVETWLAEQPHSMSWILDDALLVGRETFARVGLANLSPSAVVVWDTASDSAEPVEISPWTSVSVTLSRSTDPGPRRVRMADAPLDLSLRTAVLQLEPPGAILGPLLPTWTMSDSLDGAERSPVAETVAAGLLRMTLEPDGSQRLSLLVEVRTDESRIGWSVRVWLGERGRSSGVLRLSSDGTIVDEASGVRTAAPMVHEPGRWIADVALPRHAQPQFELVLGLELIGSDGSRATWPRRVMPWQDEPSRARIDVSTWNGLSQ
ncbi:MAG: hypothetical protein H6811_04500 [Phycisphaeraceae bacterium]|nr:hypothetical protein [Phycisphaeraceae bacterium]